EFGLAKLRTAAADADAECTSPPELLTQANELGLTMIGVPEELGGAVQERSAATTVLMSEALAQGDMGIAVACLAPAAVSTAIGADLQGQGPALFIVESKTGGISLEPDPGMGIRAAATGRLILEEVQLPATALMGGGEPATYTECIQLARLAWCALAVGTGQA